MSRPTLLVLAPLRIEANAVHRGAPGAEVVVTGQGVERARRAALNLVARCGTAQAVAVAGFGGAARDDLRPGDVVIATEVRGQGRATRLHGAEVLANAVRHVGLRVHTGAIASLDHVVRGAERSELARTGVLAVDMESAQLICAARGHPVAVVRVIVDTPARALPSRWTIPDGVRAYRTLRAVAEVFDAWARAVGPRSILLARPRSFCAGVERAIEIVERALDRFGPPVYVRKQIVHNRHVVAELESRGAVFVDELDEVPEQATVVFSAHGVAPSVRAAAEQREHHVIDATCPLVAKVHAEARRFSRQGYSVVLVGHRDHEETEGTLGEAPAVQLVDGLDAVGSVEAPDPDRVAYVTQTTLAVDEAAVTVGALRDRFPNLVGPSADDICYATQNRQDAVRALAPECDLMLVVGSRNSSNSKRLVEVAERAGCPSYLIDDERDLRLEWLAGMRTIGVTAGASAPAQFVDDVVDALGALGPVSLEERSVASESVRFALPAEVR
jgi:4-hydroxy-3-methylbut-2-en-1-yl diphosphate reductase